MPKFLPFLCTFSIMLFFPLMTEAQSLDSIRQVARDSDYAKARELCRERADYQENTDIQFLEGQIYWWDGQPREAERILEGVVEQNPGHVDAIATLTAIDVPVAPTPSRPWIARGSRRA